MEFWIILIVVLAILILWWLLTRQASFTETPTHSHSEHGHEAGEHTPETSSQDEAPVMETRAEPIAVAAAPVAPDDLVIIEGIGPKIASVLSAAGITTFAALAKTDPSQIKAILSATDERLARISDPTSWPEQARLAASGDMEALQKLQDSLKGGRQAGLS